MSEPTSKEEVGKRLAFMRERLNLGNQKDFALQIGYEPRRYGNWETGVALLPIDAAAAIVKIVPVNFDYLYRGELSGLPMRVITLLQPQAETPVVSSLMAKGRRHGS